ncbi:MAG TPA: hypothetical protein VFS40_15985 [Gemmatimonadales bacterium]|nr:hypothetical protein [Gemmatimonadales bacterium]
MPDIATISAALTSLKTATEIAKALRDLPTTLENAELKLRVADLTGALADLKLQLTEVREDIAARETRIAELEVAFERREDLVRHGDAYYRKGEGGEAVGDAFCLRCWEVEHRQRPLVDHFADRSVRFCPACKAQYDGLATPLRRQATPSSRGAPL